MFYTQVTVDDVNVVDEKIDVATFGRKNPGMTCVERLIRAVKPAAHSQNAFNINHGIKISERT